MTPAVKSRGIIFRGDMVRAILAGAKSQTRRIVKPTAKGCTVGAYATDGRSGVDIEDLFNVDEDGDPADASRFRCPYGVPGDELWVRETFSAHGQNGAACPVWAAAFVVLRDGTQVYRDGVSIAGLPNYAEGAFDSCFWRPSIHMPRWASRLTLVVESVRVERLSAITEADAKAEGFNPYTFDFETQHADGPSRPVPLVYSARDQYLRAFRTMHKLPADADPWVWVVGFRRAAHE